MLSFIIMPVLIIITLVSILFDVNILVFIFDDILNQLFGLLTMIPESLRWLNTGKIDITWVIFTYVFILMLYLIPYKWLAFIPLSTLFINYITEKKPQWQLHVFDVGHGLMVLIEKENRALIYDFGPSYFNRFSRTRSILLPYIKANNLIVATAVLSHEDNDHAGGVEHFIEAGFKSSFKQFHPHDIQNGCKVMVADFYGLKVQSFKTARFGNENDDSCVVKVSSKIHSVLLTGDISKQRERALLLQGDSLDSTVMLSPHHGSDTSSSTAFINKVSPKVVIHSSAYRGQWQFPKTAVIARYNKINALQYITGEKGQITVNFYSDYIDVITAREQESYWFIKD
jgi:competence protein ComEC